MSSHVYEIFIKRFLILYGEPKTQDVETFIGEYVKALRGYPDDALTRAADHLIKTHTFKSWPTVAECIEAIEETWPREARKYDAPEPPRPDLTPSEKARAEKLLADFKASVGNDPNLGGADWTDQPTKELTDEQRKASLSGHLARSNRAWWERDKEAHRARLLASVGMK